MGKDVETCEDGGKDVPRKGLNQAVTKKSGRDCHLAPRPDFEFSALANSQVLCFHFRPVDQLQASR
ncbi:MAG: hypothetical protein QOH96_2904, partial [Blastocatellia bacterium]|nr:hypothetical protein [Blastocatellia bacterium]